MGIPLYEAFAKIITFLISVAETMDKIPEHYRQINSLAGIFLVIFDVVQVIIFIVEIYKVIRGMVKICFAESAEDVQTNCDENNIPLQMKYKLVMDLSL